MRKTLITAGVVTLALVGAAGFMIKVVRYPTVDEPRRTDVAYILASNGGIKAMEHRAIDRIPRNVPVLLSVTPELMQLPDYQAACARTDRTVICVEPDPSTTQGEARNLARVAAERGWRAATVITHISHISRSRMLMNRCFDGEVRMTAVDAEDGRRAWAYATLYEAGAFVKAWVKAGC